MDEERKSAKCEWCAKVVLSPLKKIDLSHIKARDPETGKMKIIDHNIWRVCNECLEKLEKSYRETEAELVRLKK